MGVQSSHTAGERVRKPASRGGPARRVASLLTVALASAIVVTAAAVASAKPASLRVTALSRSGTPRPARSLSSSPATPSPAAPSASARPSAALTPPAGPAPSGVPVLTALDRRLCPATATACVDLTRHVTWLQSGGAVSFGPVWMEPGPPGSAHATPRGTFQVSWKAGPDYISNIYHDPMPWAVFFAPGGIAFHGGSLTVPSHGCVHLTIANAHYYNEHLPVGAKVVVF
jgi:lipoprotein-anchoring transpeptidase ErfK/SrfK